MTALASLDGWELLLVLALVALIGWELLKALQSRSWVAVFRPTLFVAAVLGYYVLVGPLRSLGLDGATYRGLDHRDLLVWGWFGALLSYGSLLLGFYAAPRPKLPRRLILTPDLELLHRMGLRLCQLGLSMFAMVSGTSLFALLNPLAAGQLLEGGLGERGVDVGAIANYFNYAVNFLIPGLCLMFAAWLRQRRHTPALLLWLLAAVAIYISLGFRYRLVLLAIPLLMLWFIARRKRPSLVLLAVFLASFITFNGLIGLTRSYGRGLDLISIQGLSTGDLFDAGFGESAVFYTTSGIIEQTPSRSPFIGVQPIVNTLLFPVPRALFPSKPDATYGADQVDALYGEKNSTGAAYLNYAEYYSMGGWATLVLMSSCLGVALRRLWNWFLFRLDDPFAQVVYVLNAAFLYVVISRGYMPQVVMLFFFTIVPLFLLYYRLASSVRISSLESAQ